MNILKTIIITLFISFGSNTFATDSTHHTEIAEFKLELKVLKDNIKELRSKINCSKKFIRYHQDTIDIYNRCTSGACDDDDFISIGNTIEDEESEIEQLKKSIESDVQKIQLLNSRCTIVQNNLNQLLKQK